MLTAGAAKRDHQVVEMPLQIIVDALSDDAFHMVQKHMGLRLLDQILSHFPVASGLGLELRLSSRIG